MLKWELVLLILEYNMLEIRFSVVFVKQEFNYYSMFYRGLDHEYLNLVMCKEIHGKGMLNFILYSNGFLLYVQKP